MDGGRRRSSGEDYSEEEEEYRIEDLGEGSNKSSWKKFSFRNNINCIPSSRQRQTPHSCHGFLIHPDNRSVRTYMYVPIRWLLHIWIDCFNYLRKIINFNLRRLGWQVVPTVDAVHSDMGCLLLILHSAGVWILQRPPGESLPSRHSRPNCLPYRRSCALLCGLPRRSLLPHCLQSQPNCYPLLEISFSG